MFIRLFSDLHNEFSKFILPPLDTDKDDVLVLAGDIGVAKHMPTLDVVKEWAPRFRKVIHICGNHEYYHGSLIRVKQKIREHYKDIPNLVLADDETVRVDNVSFVCSTLWTNFDKGSPWAMQAARQYLNDYNFIRTGPNQQNPYMKKINPLDILNLHHIGKDFMFNAVKEEKAIGQKVVCVSHHAPTTLSVHPRYGNDVINWAYVSDLSKEILDTQPELMVHGHTHSSFDYMVDQTRVVANPRGYQHPEASLPENHDFNPTLRLEV